MTNQIHVVCKRCNGTGQYLHYGQCFKCGGSGSIMMSPRAAKEWGYETVEKFQAIKKAQAVEAEAKAEAEHESQVTQVVKMAVASINEVASIIGFTGCIDQQSITELAQAELRKPHADRSMSGYASRVAALYIQANK